MMTTIFEYTAPSGFMIAGFWVMTGLFSASALWTGLRMPWPRYGKLVPLWDYREKTSADRLIFIGMLSVLAFGSGVIALSKQQQMHSFPSAEFVNGLPVVEGQITNFESVVIPADEDGRNSWCIHSFEVEGAYFEFSPGMNTTVFCSRDVLPKIIMESDFMRIHHDGGRVYKIERRRS